MRRGRYGQYVCEHDESERMADNRCRACLRKKQREWYHRNLGYARRKARERQTSGRQRNAHLRRNYGITLEDEHEMVLAQNGLCPACEGPLGKHHVDHDHATGAVRALLCSRCNRALGAARDDSDLLRKLAAYVESFVVITDR
jgi:Recombination endonuclease VII